MSSSLSADMLGNIFHKGFRFIKYRSAYVIRESCKHARAYTIRSLNKAVKVNRLNIGGGREFCEIGWKNLEGATSVSNPHPFHLSPQCVFPLDTGSMSVVYNSHNLEHLDDATVLRVLQEAHRVLCNDGALVLKIPDFDRALECWKNGNERFFSDEYWAFDSIKETWKKRNIPDELDYRAAMVFCGFWNKAHGAHFSGQGEINVDAYHGPPVVKKEFLRELLKTESPNSIARQLREAVAQSEGDFEFNHQNAWSKKELERLLDSCGFRVKSFQKDEIVKTFRKIIPDIENMYEQSLYCWGVRK